MIQLRNILLWIRDQWSENKFFYDIFSGNVLLMFNKTSHINGITGKPKVDYESIEEARYKAIKMSRKTPFIYYKCLYCNGYHISKIKHL